MLAFENYLKNDLLFEGLKHVQLPIPEFESPSFKQVDDFVNVVEKAKENNEVNKYLSFEWNSIRLGGPAHGIVTKTVHTKLCQGWWGSRE